MISRRGEPSAPSAPRSAGSGASALLPLLLALALAAAAASTSACGDVRGVAAERTDSAGIALVTAGVEDAALPWTIRDRFTLGGAEEGPESFYRLGARFMGTDAAAGIYVLHGNQLVVFDRDGHVRHVLGGEGGGPGELGMPGSLSVTGDGTVSVFDHRKGALVRWDGDGAVLPELRMPYRPMMGGRHHALLEGGFLVSTGGMDEQDRRVNQLLRVVDGDTTELASLLQPGRDSPAMFESCGGGINFPPLFTPHVVWDHRGGVTAVVPGAGYRVDLYRGDSLFLSVRRDYPLQSATRELAIAEAGEGFRIDFGRGPCLVPPGEYADARGWADVVPAIADLALTPEGGLWVQRRVPGDHHPPIDLFDADGRYRGTLPAGTPFPALLLDGGDVGVITTDAQDVQRLAVREVVGAGGA